MYALHRDAKATCRRQSSSSSSSSIGSHSSIGFTSGSNSSTAAAMVAAAVMGTAAAAVGAWGLLAWVMTSSAWPVRMCLCCWRTQLSTRVALRRHLRIGQAHAAASCRKHPSVQVPRQSPSCSSSSSSSKQCRMHANRSSCTAKPSMRVNRCRCLPRRCVAWLRACCHAASGVVATLIQWLMCLLGRRLSPQQAAAALVA